MNANIKHPISGVNHAAEIFPGPKERRDMLATGWAPFNLAGKGKYGRIPDGWSTAKIDDAWLTKWETLHPDWTNTSNQSEWSPGVDIDISDKGLALAVRDWFRERLGDSRLWRVGQTGGLLVYKTDEPFRRMVLYFKTTAGNREKIEILAKGQQYVCFGLHPDTLKPYEWPERSPLDTPRDDLPAITYASVLDALTGIQAFLKAKGCTDFALHDPNAERGDKFAKVPATSLPVTPEMALAILHSVPADCRDIKGNSQPLRETWVKSAGGWKSARIVHPETFEPIEDFDLFTAFDEWAATADNYPGTEATKRMWDSITVGQVGDAGFKSLVYMARQSGYKGDEHCIRDMTDRQLAAIPDLDPLTVGLAKLNRRFAVVMGGPNTEKIVDLSTPSEPRIISANGFHLMFENRKFEVPDVKKPVPISRIWLASRDRREISGMVFEPTGSLARIPAGAHNLWQGFAVKPEPGKSHEPLLAHIRENVCDNEEEFQWFVGWLANMVQEPGRKPGVNVALRGPQGAGKSVVADYMARILGKAHFCRVADRSHMTGRFNGHMANLILLNAEEGFWAGDKQAESVLKNLVTSDTLTVEKKFQDLTTYCNHLRLLVTSNEDWVVPASMNDRRWMVLDVKGTRANDVEYWKPIQTARVLKGPAHLLHFLLNHRYDAGLLHRPLMNGAKVDQTLHSLEPIPGFWFDVLSGGYKILKHAAEGDDVFSAQVPKDSVYERYAEWRAKRTRYPELSDVFWKGLRKLLPSDARETRPTIDGERKWVFRFPTREECQNAFAAEIGCPWSQLSRGEIEPEIEIEAWELL